MEEGKERNIIMDKGKRACIDFAMDYPQCTIE